MPAENQTTVRCPTCGHRVQMVFDHIGIECEHDMTEEQIALLIRQADDQEKMDASCGR